MTNSNTHTRRSFMKNSTFAAAGLSSFSIMSTQQALGSNANSMVQMGISGTGGRGQHDGRNLLKTGKVKVIALADYFQSRMKDPANLFSVDQNHCFDGIDGYKQILEMDEVDALLLTSTPYFRPYQFDDAIEAGKHVFAEKPIAVDPWGCRKFLAAGKKAKENNLTVGAGLQTRYDPERAEIAKMIQNGAIGDLVFGHSTRLGGDLWRRECGEDLSRRDCEILNWLYYQWASGDFIVEMHVHNLDVFNWFTGMLPVSAVGTGGRDVRLDVGDIFDHITVVYEYPKGFHLTHTGSQIQKGYHGSEKQIVGSDGYYDERSGLHTKDGKTVEHGGISNAVETEMQAFIDSVTGSGDYINNSDYVTTSTFTAILGRNAAYMGSKLYWDDLWNSDWRYHLPE